MSSDFKIVISGLLYLPVAGLGAMLIFDAATSFNVLPEMFRHWLLWCIFLTLTTFPIILWRRGWYKAAPSASPRREVMESAVQGNQASRQGVADLAGISSNFDISNAKTRCPFCAEEIYAVAIKCRHCQSALTPVSPIQELRRPNTPAAAPIDFRRGATQVERAAFNSSMQSFLGFELLVSACTAGIYFKSWGWGLGTFFGLAILFNVAQAKPVLALLFSTAWAIAAYLLLTVMAPTEPVAAFIAGGAGLLISLGAHQAFFQWQRDFS